MKARIEQRKKGERTRIFLLTLELREVAEWRGRRSSTTRPSHQENSCTLKCTQSTHTLDPGNYIFFIFFTPSSIKMHPISTSNFYLFISTSNFFFLFLFYPKLPSSSLFFLLTFNFFFLFFFYYFTFTPNLFPSSSFISFLFFLSLLLFLFNFYS